MAIIVSLHEAQMIVSNRKQKLRQISEVAKTNRIANGVLSQALIERIVGA
ncbi:hypothetical protein [Spirosoma oryzicola]|nr:hypothetical protein [Spirosoma oryzicola]UHG94199.1 hypothetical protein LQ777_26885 [Spirosoma oryzicola]